MQFKQNHFLHFIIILAVVIFLALGVGAKQVQLDNITKDTNRLASARLIVNAIDGYKSHFQKYPDKLEDLKDFLSPIPQDPDTNKPFSYTKTAEGYTLIIPQTLTKEITFTKKN